MSATPIPPNRARFTVEEIAAATGGLILRGGRPAVGVAIDSRALERGAAFIALRGARFDGHAFVREALAGGASALVLERADVATTPEPAVVKVRDARTALGDLGCAHRLRWAALGGRPRAVVAVTGSAGKTTTKAVAARVLEASLPGAVHASAGNLNNDVGVPMSLLGLEPHHRAAVIEVGTSARGEIARLSAIVRPDVAVLTLIAPAHTEGLGSLDEVAREKGALFSSLREGGVAIANGDDARAVDQLAVAGARARWTYGFSAGADYRIAERRAAGARGAWLRVERPTGPNLELECPLLGDAGALAVVASVAIAEAVLERPVAGADVAAALSGLSAGAPGRLSPASLADGTLVLDDSYNANPASMRASLRAAAEVAGAEQRRLVLFLGAMLEQGAGGPAEHDAIGRLAVELGAAHVVGIGGEAERISRAASAGGLASSFAPDAARAAELALAIVRPGDLVLVKGSRAIGAERVLEELRAARGAAEPAGSS